MMKMFAPPQGASATRSLARAGVIAAVYVVMTILTPFTLSFGPVQFRIAEALTLMPLLTVDAVPGLCVGCLLANLLGGGVWFDVVLGALATLLAALCTYRTREKPLLAAAFPAIFNGLIVGPVVYFAYVRAPGDPVAMGTLLFTMATVAIGEIVVCYTLGLALYYALRCLPDSVFR